MVIFIALKISSARNRAKPSVLTLTNLIINNKVGARVDFGTINLAQHNLNEPNANNKRRNNFLNAKNINL